VVISTHHAAFDLTQLAAWSDLIIDTRNAMASVPTPDGLVVKA
jgi:UDP-N-acetyl-D-mannosaminuronate dehydrogenase